MDLLRCTMHGPSRGATLLSPLGGPPEGVRPVETAHAWCRADNAKDWNLFQSILRRPDPNCRDETPPSEWQSVLNVKCTPEPLSAPKDAEVYCSWFVPPDPTRQGGDYWTISFSRGSHHPWLIYNYGEG